MNRPRFENTVDISVWLTPNQRDLLDELSTGLLAFYNATAEMEVASDVTSFTASDFGRTYPRTAAALITAGATTRLSLSAPATAAISTAKCRLWW